MLERNPFLTDEQLAKALEVSIQTIRLDRLRMNIPEVRDVHVRWPKMRRQN